MHCLLTLSRCFVVDCCQMAAVAVVSYRLLCVSSCNAHVYKCSVMWVVAVLSVKATCLFSQSRGKFSRMSAWRPPAQISLHSYTLLKRPQFCILVFTFFACHDSGMTRLHSTIQYRKVLYVDEWFFFFIENKDVSALYVAKGPVLVLLCDSAMNVIKFTDVVNVF